MDDKKSIKLTVEPRTVGPGQDVKVSWSSSTAVTGSGWLGLFASSSTANTAYHSYKYVTAGTSGSVTFTMPNTLSKTYEFRFFQDGGYDLSATSVSVEVAPPGFKKLPIDPHDLEMVTARTTPRDLAREALYAVNVTNRDHYNKSRTRLIANLSPVIVVQFSPKGGIYTLINDGVQETLSPVGPNFEMCKSIAHIPLGIYSMLAPYLRGARPVGWQQWILDFRNVIANARDHLKAAELPPEAEQSSRTIIEAGIGFLDGAISAQGFSIESFEMFTSPIQDAIRTNMRYAVQAQLDGVLPLLRRWRTQLGPAKWKQLYAVVMAIWTTEVRNQNWLLLKHMMDPETVDNHLITISTAAPEQNTVPVALENLARIVQDNLAASMVFSAPTKFDIEHATALVGLDDLLSTTIEEMLKECPRAARK